MAVGLRQRDPFGNILIDITTRLPRIIGRMEISAGVNGSLEVPPSGTNPVFFYFSVDSITTDFSNSPRFTISGPTNSTISWQYTATGQNQSQAGGVITYGRY